MLRSNAKHCVSKHPTPAGSTSPRTGSSFEAPLGRLRTRRLGSRTSAQRRLHDPVGIADGFAALDLVDVLHARNDLAPDRVLPVEKAGVAKADEELRIGRIRARGARHRHRAAHMRLGVEL